MKRDAAWLLRRYYDGGAPGWRLEQVLERELQRLVRERYELQSEVGELRRSASGRLRSFDEATDRALQWNAERRFGEALRELRQAAEDLRELRRVLSVAAELEAASRAIEEIEFLLDPGLAGLTTPGVLRRLRGLARQLLDQGEARKARFVVLLLSSQSDRLRSQERTEPASGFRLALKELASRGGAGAVESLRRLVRDGYLDLAERLAEDLDSEHAVQERSRRSAQAQGGLLGPLLEEVNETRRRADLVSRSLATWLAAEAPPETA